ncbi:hypothetical protein ACEPAG_4321 [Sanghuangporus baumii]
MSTSLPLHRSSAERVGGWRSMAIDNDSAFSTAHLVSVLRLKPFRILSRSGFLILLGTISAVWFVFAQFGSPSFWGGPPFPPPLRAPPPGFRPPPFDGTKATPEEWAFRADEVKKAFLHAYHGYERYASPRDELLPLSNGSVNNFNGWGVTMVDSLDTMYMMGLHDEFDRGVKLVKKMQIETHNDTVPFFETVIRYLGGLLSAYGLSKDPVLLHKADELGAALLPAFNTTSGFPVFAVNPATGQRSGGWGSYSTGWLAEIASCMMEYKYLAKVTGKKEYYDAANTIMRRLYDADLSKYPRGMLPSLWNLSNGQPVNDQFTIGAMADSAFEYFLKQYLLVNQTEPESLELYMRTMQGILDHNLFISPSRSFLYVTDVSVRTGNPSRRFEHLSCFLPGLFALGADQLPPSAFVPFSDALEEDQLPSELERHLWAAKGLAISCALMYEDMPTGLGADEVAVLSAADIEREQIRQRRIKESQLAREKAKAEAEAKQRERERNQERANVEKERRAPPHVVTDKWPAPRPKVADRLAVNQTEEDIKSRWANVLAAWRLGKYDGDEDIYIDVDDELMGRIFGNMWHDNSKAERKGPIPGTRDPPRLAVNNTELGRDYRPRSPSYQLRPETIESFFIMWRTTGDEIWRERGWAAFSAIERRLRTPSGYATIRSVFNDKSLLQDSMPSFFLAETLKYLYLLFSDEALLPLDQYVFNTEAHPFPVFEWTETEKKKFGIAS